MPTQTKPSIVFAHGLWADGSCFNKLIPALQAEGHEVICSQHGLDSQKGDVECVVRCFGRVNSPVVLVGHSYGGTLITHAGADDRVAALSSLDPERPLIAWRLIEVGPADHSDASATSRAIQPTFGLIELLGGAPSSSLARHARLIQAPAALDDLVLPTRLREVLGRMAAAASVAAASQRIPADFWQALRRHALVDARSPLPGYP